MKEERVRTQIEDRSFVETRKPLGLSSDETDCACAESCRLVNCMWEDERVWPESLVLSTFVCLFDNPYGKPVKVSRSSGRIRTLIWHY